MQTSIAITDFSWPGPLRTALHDVAAMVDASTIDSLFVSDHVVQVVPHTAPRDPWLEAFTTLGALAVCTHHVRLGVLVAAVTLRPPALLVKAVTTLDVLSGGRAWFGIGAGRLQAEADAFGLAFPPTGERFDWLEDTLALARRMWAGDTDVFHGRRLTAEQPIASPPPATRPHPPVLIGGTGETKTLGLVARYGDACNLFDVDDDGAEIRHKLAVLADHCARVDRTYDEITKTVSTRLHRDDTAIAFVERARRLADSGADHLIVLTDGPWAIERVAVLADAAQQLTDIPTTSRKETP
jgi:alkanesulfonate monooxygenase SsuD/methylene tetrahydromethanopterin reductase-like flavin-dependent oxidoreductase (luciferase family)